MLQIPETRQLVVVHLSDVHFGSHHRFDPGQAAGGGRLPAAGHPKLIDSLVDDLADVDPGCPVIVCITGDLTQTASSKEFREAENFIKRLATASVFGKVRGIQDIFVVPGNHDVQYAAELPEDRWSPWTQFHNNTFGTSIASRDGSNRFSFHNRIEDLGAIVVCLNSSEYVEKGSPREKDGVIDFEQLAKLKDFLDNIPQRERNSAIRIALIHHHPVLIPGLTEADKGYDAIANAGYLLNELRNYGFHLVLHGHKHVPYHFSEDSYTALHEEQRSPILIVAGGSVGSTEIPEGGQNCYNKIAVKWNPDAGQGRVLLSTRGLVTKDKGAQRLPNNWTWAARLIDDRQHIGGPRAPQTYGAQYRAFTSDLDGESDTLRRQAYSDLRGNMPVCEVMPSLIPGQHNEVRLWIELHRGDLESHQKPVEVTWSAGPRHPVVTVPRDKDERYCATLHYYGPMLVQAKLRFPDGKIVHGYVYARMPKAYPRSENTIDVG